MFDHWYGPAVLTDRPVQRVKIFEDNDVKIVRIATPTLYVNDNLVDVDYNLIVIEKASGRCNSSPKITGCDIYSSQNSNCFSPDTN